MTQEELTGTDNDRALLSRLSVKELRGMARKRGCNGAALLTLSKAALVSVLAGEVPFQDAVSAQKGAAVTSTDVVELLAAALNGKVGIDLESIEELIADKVTDAIKDVKPGVCTVEVRNIATGQTNKVGVQHKQFECVLALASARLDCMLVGPAGSGKTTLAEKIAEALELPYYSIPVGLQTTKSDLLGYMSADGRYVRTLLRDAYEHGGVFLIDEIDAANPNVLTVLNGLLANGLAAFPDGMVKRHADFVCIAAANTFGRGADRVYVGRNQLDGASLDRFWAVDFDYDEDLEAAISPEPAWTAYVQKIRKAVFDLREKVVVSPRASIKGGLMIKAYGWDYERLADGLIWRGINPEIKSRIMARI